MSWCAGSRSPLPEIGAGAGAVAVAHSEMQITVDRHFCGRHRYREGARHALGESAILIAGAVAVADCARSARTAESAASLGHSTQWQFLIHGVQYAFEAPASCSGLMRERSCAAHVA